MIAAHVRHFTRTRAGTTHALEFFGGDTPPLDEKGCWFSIHAVDHDAHKIGGLLHVRTIPGHDHAAVMVSPFCSLTLSRQHLLHVRPLLQDYLTLWVPHTTGIQRRKMLPDVLKDFDSIVSGDVCVLAACSDSMLPYFEAAGWRISYTIDTSLAPESHRTNVVATSSTPITKDQLVALRALDTRNPMGAKHIYPCSTQGCQKWASFSLTCNVKK